MVSLGMEDRRRPRGMVFRGRLVHLVSLAMEARSEIFSAAGPPCVSVRLARGVWPCFSRQIQGPSAGRDLAAHCSCPRLRQLALDARNNTFRPHQPRWTAGRIVLCSVGLVGNSGRLDDLEWGRLDGLLRSVWKLDLPFDSELTNQSRRNGAASRWSAPW